MLEDVLKIADGEGWVGKRPRCGGIQRDSDRICAGQAKIRREEILTS